MDKALLILVGGRPIPNVLTIIHEKPDIIVAICSKESIGVEWVQLQQVIDHLSPGSTIDSMAIDAYDIDNIKETCKNAFLKYPQADWIFNATGATSLMTLGAYLAALYCAKQDGALVRCWFLNTARSKIISLIGEERASNLFHLTVEQYVAAYNYGLQYSGSTKNYRARYLKEDLKIFAKRLGNNPQEVVLLKQIVDSDPKQILNSTAMYNLLRDLENVGLVRGLQEKDTFLSIKTLTPEQKTFLNGAWLELYVYHEAKSLDFFDSAEWAQEIIDRDINRHSTSTLTYKDMDVSLAYKAQLMIIECKTGKDGLEAKTLDDIVTIANLVGWGYVIKILVTSNKREKASEDFQTKAKTKGVHVFTQEDLPQIGAKLIAQAKLAESTRR